MSSSAEKVILITIVTGHGKVANSELPTSTFHVFHRHEHRHQYKNNGTCLSNWHTLSSIPYDLAYSFLHIIRFCTDSVYPFFHTIRFGILFPPHHTILYRFGILFFPYHTIWHTLSSTSYDLAYSFFHIIRFDILSPRSDLCCSCCENVRTQ